MSTRIGPRTPHRHYLREWRDHRSLTQQQLADRLETNSENISRWENNQRAMNSDTMAAVAEALDIDVRDLWRHPDTPSADELLRSAPPVLRDQAMAVIAALVKKAG